MYHVTPDTGGNPAEVNEEVIKAGRAIVTGYRGNPYYAAELGLVDVAQHQQSRLSLCCLLASFVILAFSS